MKYLFPILFILLVGCTKKIYVPVNSYHTITETLHDTIIDVKLDVIRDSIITDDTISVLSNKYSKTTAKWSNNRLYHSLSINDITIPVRIEYKDRTVIDSIQVPYPVKGDPIKMPLNWYEKICVYGFTIIIGTFFSWLILKIKRGKL